MSERRRRRRPAGLDPPREQPKERDDGDRPEHQDEDGLFVDGLHGHDALSLAAVGAVEVCAVCGLAEWCKQCENDLDQLERRLTTVR